MPDCSIGQDVMIGPNMRDGKRSQYPEQPLDRQLAAVLGDGPNVP